MDTAISVLLIILLLALIIYFVSLVVWLLRATAVSTRYVELERSHFENRLKHATSPPLATPPSPPAPALKNPPTP